MFLCACDVLGSQGRGERVRLPLCRQAERMDMKNPLAELPGEVLEEMPPGERLAYLVHEGEPVPDEVRERARQVHADPDPEDLAGA